MLKQSLILLTCLFSYSAYANLNVNAYTQDTSPTNVRTSPNGPVKKIESRNVTLQNETFILIVEQSGEWVRIASAEDVEGTAFNLGQGASWIHISKVDMNTGDREVNVYSDKNDSSRVLAVIGGADSVGYSIVEFQTNWIKLQLEQNPAVYGWVKTGSMCGNPVTTCP